VTEQIEMLFEREVDFVADRISNTVTGPPPEWTLTLATRSAWHELRLSLLAATRALLPFAVVGLAFVASLRLLPGRTGLVVSGIVVLVTLALGLLRHWLSWELTGNTRHAWVRALRRITHRTLYLGVSTETATLWCYESASALAEVMLSPPSDALCALSALRPQLGGTVRAAWSNPMQRRILLLHTTLGADDFTHAARTIIAELRNDWGVQEFYVIPPGPEIGPRTAAEVARLIPWLRRIIDGSLDPTDAR